jgi:aarF domain-containing kinase
LALAKRTKEYYYHFIFRASLLGLDAIFWVSKVRQYLGNLFGFKTVGFEDELERQARIMAKTTMGVDVAPGVFEG